MSVAEIEIITYVILIYSLTLTKRGQHSIYTFSYNKFASFPYSSVTEILRAANSLRCGPT